MAEAVKVIVRCRPLNGREKNLKCRNVIEMDPSIGQCRLLKTDAKTQTPKAFTFDGVFNTDSITESIYADICFPLVEGCVEGYNGTVFAYGQTGCGKSFTMQGIEDPPTQRGIIPRAFDHIFESIQVADNSKFLVHASYLEIYNEEIRDLLAKEHKTKLDVKEHPDRGVYVKDLSMIPCNSVRDMDNVMDRGAQNRSVGATLMNADSSRSHSIFTIFVETCDQSADGSEHIRAGKLNLVDLAGSERQAKTGASGDRLKEATKINLSLSALGNVISALVDGKSKHIPYRDSKLTRLLQDSLGGNTKTLMVACISPADNNYDETLSTLRYANRAKNIKNKPKINEDPKDAMLRQFQDEISILKQVLMGQVQMTPDIIAKLGLNSGTQGIVPALTPSATALAPSLTPATTSPTTTTTTGADEADRIRNEYEQKLSKIQHLYEEEKLTKNKLEEEVGKLQSELKDTLKEASHSVTGFHSDNAKTVIDNFNENLNTISADVLPLDRNADFLVEPTVEQTPEQVPMSDQTTGHTSSGKPADVRAPSNSSDVRTLAVNLQDEALKKLNSLQQKLVGGEKCDNTELKKKHKRKKEYADAREKKLLEDIKKWEGEKIMVKVYDNLQDEIKVKREEISALEIEVSAANTEISDLQSEFQAERTDFLETIRRLERQLQLQNQLLGKIQPTIRRDCNYYNIDRMKILSEFDEDTQAWKIPELTIEKTSLPKTLPGQENLSSMKPSPNHQSATSKITEYHDRSSDPNDRYSFHIYNKQNEEYSNQYFRPKRADKLLSGTMTTAAASSATTVNNHVSNLNIAGKLQPLPGTSPCTSVQELQTTRRPQKLEALPLSAFEKKKSKKSKNKDVH